MVKQFFMSEFTKDRSASRLSNDSLNEKQDDFNFHRKVFLRSTGLF
jgi:hypothetical protein